MIVSDAFLTGERANREAQKARPPFSNYFTTYNRTDLQERVQDLITISTFAQNYSKGRRVILCGSGGAGLWALLAAPVVDAVGADCDSFDVTSDEALLAPDLFVQGIRKLGAFEGIATLAAPHPLLMHNLGTRFSTKWIEDVYRNLKVAGALRRKTQKLDDHAIEQWIAGLKFK